MDTIYVEKSKHSIFGININFGILKSIIISTICNFFLNINKNMNFGR